MKEPGAGPDRWRVRSPVGKVLLFLHQGSADDSTKTGGNAVDGNTLSAWPR